MSTNEDLPDIESCKLRLIDRPEDREKAIECYSNFIAKTESLLKLTGNVEKREHICKQIAVGYNERGFVKYMQVDFKEAIEDYTKALSFDSKLHFTYYNRGLVHYRLGRFDQAIEDMSDALRLKTNFEPALKCLEQAQKDEQCTSIKGNQSVES